MIEKEERRDIIAGRRVVDIQYLLQQTVGLQAKHSKVCTSGLLELKAEKRVGLVSTFKYECNLCSKNFFVHSEKPDKPILNKAVVWGTLATGSINDHLLEFFSVLEVPIMSKMMFYDIQNKLGSVSLNTFLLLLSCYKK